MRTKHQFHWQPTSYTFELENNMCVHVYIYIYTYIYVWYVYKRRLGNLQVHSSELCCHPPPTPHPPHGLHKQAHECGHTSTEYSNSPAPLYTRVQKPVVAKGRCRLTLSVRMILPEASEELLVAWLRICDHTPGNTSTDNACTGNHHGGKTGRYHKRLSVRTVKLVRHLSVPKWVRTDDL